MRPFVRGSMPAFIAFMYSTFMSFTVGAESFIVYCCAHTGEMSDDPRAQAVMAAKAFIGGFSGRRRRAPRNLSLAPDWPRAAAAAHPGAPRGSGRPRRAPPLLFRPRFAPQFFGRPPPPP